MGNIWVAEHKTNMNLCASIIITSTVGEAEGRDNLGRFIALAKIDPALDVAKNTLLIESGFEDCIVLQVRYATSSQSDPQ